MPLSLDRLVRAVAAQADAKPENPAFLFLDELTYASKWDRWLKTFYDEQWPVRIAASSSSAAELRRGRHESGIGRWDEQNLPPLLFTEYLNLLGVNPDLPDGDDLGDIVTALSARPMPTGDLSKHRERYLLTGGFPELVMSGGGVGGLDSESLAIRSQDVLRKDAIERAIYKDIPQAVGVESPMMLERVLYTLAGQIGGVLSPQNICKGLGNITQPTLERYISYLEQSFLIFLLPNYSATEETRQRRGRKVFFMDGAARNAALLRGAAPLQNLQELGALTENLAASHLYALGVQTSTRVYFWRDRNEEADLVYDHPTAPLAFEITTSDRHKRSGLRAFQERFPRFAGRCYVVSPGAAHSPPDASGTPGKLSLDWFLIATSAIAERTLVRRLSRAPLQRPLFGDSRE